MRPVASRQTLLAALLLSALVACSQQRSMDAAAPPEGAARAETAAAAPASAPAAATVEEAKTASAPAGGMLAGQLTPAQAATQLTSTAATYTDAQRKFIRTAHVEFRVKDVYGSAMEIENLVATHGGFVVHNDIVAEPGISQSRPDGQGHVIELTEYTTRGNLVVRVPSEDAQKFLRALAAQVEYLDHRTFDAADAQFDLLRQELARQRAQQSQAELGQAADQGGRLDQRVEALQASDAARGARDEALIGQKQFEDRIAFATIDLSIYQTPTLRMTQRVDVQAEFARNSPGFFARLSVSLRHGWNGFLDVVIALAALWPLWVFVLGVLVLMRLFAKRQRTT